MTTIKAAWPCKECGGAPYLDVHHPEHPADLLGYRIVCARCGKGLTYTRQPYVNDQVERWNRKFGKEPAPFAPEEADKPECRTCPLWEAASSYAGRIEACHHSGQTGQDGDALQSRPDWYCEHHPDYPAWAVEELARRKAARRGKA